MIKLNFIKPKESNRSLKLTVQKSGRLGFSKNASELLRLNSNKYCKFATNADDQNDEYIYMVVYEERDDLSFKISKGGDYFFIKAKNFLSDLEIDYTDETKTVIFDIQEIEYNESKIYKLKKRVIEKKPSS